MLLPGEKDPERRKALETINAQAFRAFEMLSDLMLFANPPALVRTTFDVRELLDQVIREHASAAMQQRTEVLSADVPSDLITLRADRNQLAAALAACLKNSLEALKTGGEIQVAVDEHKFADEKPYLEFIIADNGPGISPAVRRHLFDPFFSGREAGRGLGLGLCKVWRIAELHGGDVQVVSTPGQGAKFCLRIPRQPLPTDSA